MTGLIDVGGGMKCARLLLLFKSTRRNIRQVLHPKKVQLVRNNGHVIDEKVIEYILDLVIATRPGRRNELSSRQSGANLDEISGLLSFGASPRASIALALAARGYAFLQGRAYVLPQDVKALAPDVLRHRIILSYEAEAEGIDTDAVISRLLDQLRTP